jgi:lipid-A-disaccharide synthase
MLRVPYVSLPNNLLQRWQVPEFLQSRATPRRLADALLELLESPEKAQQQTAPFAGIRRQLQRQAASRAAQLVLDRSNH